ncbi:hypothetical protein MSAN_02501100 [Mycena sanguinolenta]|uniref:Uncharacterized protein n=1 Tax=Mycena sanguinolenta TaxID=230812 RepID=A0A8H6WR53_9AGAR|nr:hypothetical protein MSAN_02501100 [Mycena sanguinolenta]
MATTIGYLWKFSSNGKRSFFGRLDHIMLHEGVIYFVGLAVFNTVNLILFQNTDTSVQPIAAVLGYAATMIYSSRFVLNVSDHSRANTERTSSSRPRASGYRGPNIGVARDDTEMVMKVVRNGGRDGQDRDVESDTGNNTHMKGSWAGDDNSVV